jgi:outer membrane receptor protein involved in Fe transport
MKLTKRTALGALLASLAAPSVVAEGRQIEEVIVTAERQEASIQDTSISITAFTGEFIDDFGIRNQEDLQNFVPATTIQPYDATVRGVGRNFRALGGDPGVATYMNGVYSEDLLTATAATFWDVERIEVLRGPQGTLYGRNAVGGAINILYKEPTDVFEGAVKAIYGNFGTEEYYGAFSGPLSDTLMGRVNFSYRDREGVIEQIGAKGVDHDGLGTENIAVQLKWLATDDVTVDVRHAWMEIDRPFGGANGGGLVVLNEDGKPSRSTDLIPGYRFVDPAQTLATAGDYVMPGQEIRQFTNPLTGETQGAQVNRAGLDYMDADGFQNAMASLDGWNVTDPNGASLAAHQACVFPGDIDGKDICAGTNGLNHEAYDTSNTQMTVTWDASDRLSLKYIYGFNEISYHRTTDDDNTASDFHDRQFYVNHEARYSSHEIQAFYDISDTMSVTSGVFWYDAVIDQRGDFYSEVGSTKYQNAAVMPTALIGEAGAAALGGLEDLPVSALLANGAGIGLFSAREACQGADAAETCSRNYSADNSAEQLGILGTGTRNDNLVVGTWAGDDGTSRDLDVIHGPRTVGSDLLYATQTERTAFAAYTQGVWDFAENLTLTIGVRYAYDEVLAEENLFRYTETMGTGDILARLVTDDFVNPIGQVLDQASYLINSTNGGFVVDDDSAVVLDADTGLPTATQTATNGGFPIAVSVYRPFDRKDEKVTGRINLDWDINDEIMMYLSATSGYRSGGYNLVFFSNTADYDPEELTAYEIGYKTQFLDNTLQINGSFYFYDYESIHTVATEVTSLGGTSTSVLPAPGAEVMGIEAEVLWLATDALTLGGNFSYTPNEYTKDLMILDPARVGTPTSLYPDQETNELNINGNQLLQVPELKYTVYGTYSIPLDAGANLDISSVYSWTDDVYYSPFENQTDMAKAYGRLDIRATWSNAEQNLEIAAFCNNVMDDVAVLQVLRHGEAEHFRQTGGTTVPRLFGVELTYRMGAY